MYLLLLYLQLFAIIVFGCISSQGWRIENGQNYCLYNGDAFACKYGTTIGVIGFLAAMVFLVGEFMFERMSSVKSRKHFVLGDLAFSGELYKWSLNLRYSTKRCYLIFVQRFGRSCFSLPSVICGISGVKLHHLQPAMESIMYRQRSHFRFSQ